MVKVRGFEDGCEYTVVFDDFDSWFYVVDEYGEVVDEGSTGSIEFDRYNANEGVYVRI